MASEVMWRRLSDEEKKKIEAKAKAVMFDFGKTLEKLPKMNEAFVEREHFEREEGNGNDKGCDNDFRNLMFENAPKKDEHFIIAERGKWIEK